jgi:hypothetical protein
MRAALRASATNACFGESVGLAGCGRCVRCVERVEAIGPAFRSKYTEEASLGLVRRRHECRISDDSKSARIAMGRTRDQARLALFRYIESFYNPLRRQSSLQMLGPTNMNADTWRTPRQPPPKKDVNGNGGTPTPPRLHGAFEQCLSRFAFPGVLYSSNSPQRPRISSTAVRTSAT